RRFVTRECRRRRPPLRDCGAKLAVGRGGEALPIALPAGLPAEHLVQVAKIGVAAGNAGGAEARPRLDPVPLLRTCRGRRREQEQRKRQSPHRRTSIFPVLPPLNRPRKASGIASIPSCTVSRDLTAPEAIQPPISR